MAGIDRVHVDNPAYGARKIARVLRSEGMGDATRWRVTRLMREMNVRPCCPLPSLSRPSKGSRRFPYLLRGKRVDFPNQVWSTDITYVQIGGRHMYLTAVIDWHSRYVVGWSLSNTMTAQWCVAALREAFERHGCPEIVNSDQGSQFTSADYVELLNKYGFECAAMALEEDSVPPDHPSLQNIDKLAVILGTEGTGLRRETIEACRHTVMIPMYHGVDSLNVAAASAVIFWQLRKK